MLAEGGPKSRGLEGVEELNQMSINKHFVCIDQWGQAFQLIIYEAKRGGFEGLCLALS